MASPSEAATEHPALSRISEVCRASACLQPQGMREMKVQCEAAKATLRCAFLDLVHQHQGQPLLTSKSCDGTPINVVHGVRITLPSGEQQKARG
eukprot:9372728-Lingulodinium_polyedra.AAC.1